MKDQYTLNAHQFSVFCRVWSCARRQQRAGKSPDPTGNIHEDSKFQNMAASGIIWCILRTFFQFCLSLFVIFFPLGAWAASTQEISFTPPPSDVSVVFLTDVFGVVDGVLSGGGSQIMGSMFALFNSSVLALGGIILIYTTIVGTINTANDGQVLGKDWNSIWIPVRTTIGVSLLYTYPSGYSVLQIFVMWIIVQGVGAADLIWNAALGYLQRGGVIVQPMPTTSSAQASAMTSSQTMMSGAGAILTGVTCMQALQQQLQVLQTTYQNQANQTTPTGPCVLPSDSTSWTSDQTNMAILCNNPIPNLLDNTSVMAAQATAMAQCSQCTAADGTNCTVCTDSSGDSCTQGSTGCSCTVSSACQNDAGGVTCSSTCGSGSSGAAGTYAILPMPNLDSDSPYVSLNGICGTVTWNLMNSSSTQSTASELGLSQQDAMLMENTRAVAVQQMFTDLSSVGQSMVQNDQSLFSTTAVSCDNGTPCYFYQTSYAPTAPFGLPSSEVNNYTACSGITGSPLCTEWVSPQTGFTSIFNGTEFWGAVSDYNSIMAPTLNAEDNTSAVASATSFISNAESQGWIMAGSYFYNLENVNAEQYASCTSSSGDTSSCTSQYDTDSGLTLTTSTGATYPLYPPGLNSTSYLFCANGGTSTSGVPLCTWYGAGDSASSNGALIQTYNNQIAALILGPTPTSQSTSQPNSIKPIYSVGTGESVNNASGGNWPEIYTNELNTTVYGYIGNASNLLPPGQSGATMSSGVFMPPVPTMKPPTLSNSCPSGYGSYSIAGAICLLVGNNLIGGLIQGFLSLIITVIHTLFELILYAPLSNIAGFFKNTISIMNQNTSNPIVSLTTTGAMYINACANIWVKMGLLQTVLAAWPGAAGLVLICFLTMVVPLVYSWLGLIFSLGVLLAYFIPMIPYVLFTFGALGWLMSAIEAMVAAPIVALGVMLPEGGHQVFGKGVAALMLILAAFLRPAMMIIGYIAGIIVATVGIWMINTGFSQFANTYLEYSGISTPMPGISGSSLAYLFASIFLFFMYVTMCVTVIEQSFELIYLLPDNILRWIGGSSQDSYSGKAAEKALGAVKSQTEKTGKSLKESIPSVGGAGGKKKGKDGGIGGTGGGGDGGGDTSIQTAESTEDEGDVYGDGYEEEEGEEEITATAAPHDEEKHEDEEGREEKGEGGEKSELETKLLGMSKTIDLAVKNDMGISKQQLDAVNKLMLDTSKGDLSSGERKALWKLANSLDNIELLPEKKSSGSGIKTGGIGGGGAGGE